MQTKISFKTISIGRLGTFMSFLFISFFSNAQNEVWFFGNGNPGIDFSGGSAVQYNGVSGQIFGECITVVSDGAGGVIYYSNGQEVFDGSFNTMLGGNITGSGGNSSAQGAISVRNPADDGTYYLFTAGDLDEPTNNGIRWHEIDITAVGSVANGGTIADPLGEVVSADNAVVAESGEMLCATNCGSNSTWVLGHEANTDRFVAIPVTAAGPQAPVYTSIGAVFDTEGEKRGTISFNSTGDKFVITGDPTTRMYDFDLTTGVVSNEVVISSRVEYGSEWSPNDAYVYLSGVTGGSSGINRYDVATTLTTTVSNSNDYYGQIAKGDDGVLYIGKWAGLAATTLATITNPNSTTATAAGVGFNQNGYSIGMGAVGYGLPQNFVCPLSSCPDTAITQPSDICVGLTEDLSAHEAGDAGSWTITSTPAGSNPAIMSGDIFDASAANTDPGIYTVTFTVDAPVGGCANSSSRDIEVFGNPTVNLGNDTSICSDANITFDAGAGYSYAWTPGGQSGQTINVNTANTYGVTITDGNGCTGTDNIVLTIDTLPVVDLGNDTSICSDANITFDAGAGYSYAWTPGGQSGQTINVNTANSYGVTITDGNGCTGTDNIVLTIDTLPVVDLGNDTSICSDANITFDAGAGYSYAWTPGGQSGQTINVNTANTYGVTITDGNGCIGTDNIVLTIDTLPVVDLGNDTSICSDANITFDAGAGYSYAWTPGGQSTQTINVNTANTYGVTITDGNGCIGTDNIVLTIDTLPVVDLGNDTSICADSTLVLDAVVGTAWSWNNGDKTQTTTVNTDGQYDVVVTDGNGCVGYDTIAVSINALPIVDLGNDTSICADSTLILDAAVGSSWLWNGGVTSQDTIVNTGGQYDVIVTDANGCVGYDTINVVIDTLPVVFLGADTSICADSTLLLDAGNAGAASYVWSNKVASEQTSLVNTTGVYDVVVTTTAGCVGYDTISLVLNDLPIPDLGIDSSLCAGDSMELFTGLSNVSLAWNPTGEVTDTIVVNSAGVYDVIVTDSNNCVGYDTVVVTVDALAVVDLGVDSSLCAGDEMTIRAGNSGSTFLWNNGAVTQNITIDSASNYIVTVTNPALCSASDSVLVTVDTLPIVDLGMDTAICDLDTILFDAGNAGSIYLWSNAASTQSISVWNTGVYSVSVTNSYNCSASDTVNVLVNNLPNVDLGPDRVVCEYLHIDLWVAEDSATYTWSNGSANDSISINQPGTYYIDVVDTNGCFKSDTVVVNPGPMLTVDLGSDEDLCAGDAKTLQPVVGLATGTQSFDWSTNEVNTSITVNQTGQYSVLVIDAIGCWGRDTAAITFHTLPTVDISASRDTICSIPEADEEIVLKGVHNGAYLEWNTGDINDSITINTSGFYEVVVYDNYGCNTNDTMTITEWCRPVDVTLPNIFTPNGDGYNDSFIPFEVVWEDLDYMMVNLEYVRFKVLNRWGQQVFVSTGVLPNWDGRNNRGMDMSDGTYFWTLEFKTISGDAVSENGFVKLTR